MLPPPLVREDLPPVAKAAQVVSQTLQLDESYPDIDSYCRRMYPFPYFFLPSWPHYRRLTDRISNSWRVFRLRYPVRRILMGSVS